MIIVWGITSVIYAIVIHILFHWSGPAWITAKWSAGDILTYASTVSLGLLAVWQNKKFQEENDKTQEKLQKISIRANELNVIATIANQETERLKNLRSLLDEYASTCDVRGILSCVCAETSEAEEYTVMEMRIQGICLEKQNRLEQLYTRIIREICWHHKPNLTKDSLEAAVHKLCEAVDECIKYLSDPQLGLHSNKWDELVKSLDEAKMNFIDKREACLAHENDKLRQLLYGDLTLDQIKELYSKD